MPVSTGEELLLFILNSTPLVNGDSQDLLADPTGAPPALRRFGGTGSPEELEAVRAVRPLLQQAVRGDIPADALASALTGVHRTPRLTATGLTWTLVVASDRRLAVQAVLAWAEMRESAPGRLRPCANDECRLFLVDRSRANTARWCSMATCGNRLKARRHYRRSVSPDA
ncbi:CGNR zinc finger domain-containing protein [Micromonospora sp. WMMD964]|uniref:CGNR zinc finger domain-containing protein n=1 Tax=Micromonospora sp. WMMD964 TaxID=3016091 RepID=UPI00249B9000|nr:CGNR zinc finger domain-containing protein [Micromonospora sp. WMMD964]WFF00233.1 CGNR zinc finger domain-containing protein [Micromonospora sp. WMMD964]